MSAADLQAARRELARLAAKKLPEMNASVIQALAFSKSLGEMKPAERTAFTRANRVAVLAAKGVIDCHNKRERMRRDPSLL